MKAWDKFFCRSCQTERPLVQMRQVNRYRQACTGCIQRATVRADAERFKPVRGDYELRIETLVPVEIMAAYQESRCVDEWAA